MPHLRMALQKLKERLRNSNRRTRGVIGAALVALMLWLVLPWGTWAGHLLQRELISRGIEVESFDLRRVSLGGAKFKHVKITAPVALTIPILELKLSTVSLLRANWEEAVSHVEVAGIELQLSQNTDGSWNLNGKQLPKLDNEAPDEDQVWHEELLEQLSPLLLFPEVEARNIALTVRTNQHYQFSAMFQLQSSRTAEGFTIAATAEPMTLQMEESGGELRVPKMQLNGGFQHEGNHLNLVANLPQVSWQAPGQHGSMDVLLSVNGSSNQTPSMQLTASSMLYDNQGGVKFSNAQTKITLSAHNAEELFPATLMLDAPALQFENVPAKFAALNAQAVCNVDELHVLCNRVVASTPTRAISATGMAGVSFDQPANISWTMNGVANNVLGGRLRFEATAPQKGGLTPAKITLMADRLGLQEVLSMLAEGKIKASGSVSGQIPLTWHGGSDMRFGKGSLRADGFGHISISPDLLAMDNPQVAMVSGILQDFRYQKLSISLSPAPGKKGSLPGLKATLSTLGNNPTKLEGHPVKLNVNLSGDLLSFLKQSILPMSDPEQWLQNSN